MKERPILLSAWEVRAILAGTKTRITRPIRPSVCVDDTGVYVVSEGDDGAMFRRNLASPFGEPGDVLIGKETWQAYMRKPGPTILAGARMMVYAYPATPGDRIDYRADHENPGGGWRSSTTMPRWAARIVLRVETECVGRVRDISAEDTIADGARDTRPDDPLWESVAIQDFRALWDATYAKRGLGYDTNCWTFSATFSRVAPGDGEGDVT